MNIREAINMTGQNGKIRLDSKVIEIIRDAFCELDKNEAYIFSVEELVSLDWEALKTEWVEHYE